MNKKLYARAKLLGGLLITFSIFGILFIPVFPWITTNDNGTIKYASEGMIDGWTMSYLKSVAGFDMGSYFNPDQLKSVFGMLSPLTGLSHSIYMISVSFWFTLFLGFLILVSLAFYKIDKRYEIVSYVLLLIGCISIISSALVLIFHVQFVFNLSSVASSIEKAAIPFYIFFVPSFKFSSAYFGYNYVPLVFGVLALIVSIIYTKIVFSTSIGFIRNKMQAKK